MFPICQKHLATQTRCTGKLTRIAVGYISPLTLTRLPSPITPSQTICDKPQPRSCGLSFSGQDFEKFLGGRLAASGRQPEPKKKAAFDEPFSTILLFIVSFSLAAVAEDTKASGECGVSICKKPGSFPPRRCVFMAQ